MFEAFDDLLFCRGWEMYEGRCGITPLFCDQRSQNRSRVVGGIKTEIEWTIPQEFYTSRLTEPLHHKHARRGAFGLENAKLVKPDALRFPARYILSMLEGYDFYSVGYVSVSWLTNGVFEVPCFCTGMAVEGQMRLEYGFDPKSIDYLQAAKEIEPRKYDVVGVVTEDFRLAGAFEFWESLGANQFLGNLFYISNSSRTIHTDDILIGKFSTMIGETRIDASRQLLKVVDAGDCSRIPQLEPAG